YVLPDVEQAQLATVMAELMDYVMEYLQIHQDYGLTVSANGLRQLTEQFMRDNRKRKGVQKSLRDLKNTLSFNRAPLILQEDKLLTRYVNGKIR
ncbi:hypothetical protein, partial [Salmonella enterica]|uniref:hypothetical protein n=1 Tax=Salmonella enterica TaxID=28901 RepID=UPI003D2CDCF0